MNKVTNEKLPRGLDGFFLRVKRGDRYVNRCFTDLTGGEQRNWLDRLSAEGLRRMTGELLNCVQKMKDMQDLTEEELRDITFMTGKFLRSCGDYLGVSTGEVDDESED